MVTGTRYRQELLTQLNPFGLLAAPLLVQRDRGTYINLTTSAEWGYSTVRDHMPPAVYAAYTAILNSLIADVETGVAEATATLNTALAQATLSATAVVDVVGATTELLENATLAATATVEVVGSLSKTLANASLTSTAIAEASATSTRVLEDAVAAATGQSEVAGTLTATLENATLASVAGIGDGSTAELNVTLEDATLNARARAIERLPIFPRAGGISIPRESKPAVRAVVNVQLEDATLAATARVESRGTADIKLEDASVVSSAYRTWDHVIAEDDELLLLSCPPPPCTGFENVYNRAG